MIVQILSISMGLIDFAMAGQLGIEQLGAAALGTTYFNLLFHPLVGSLMALDTLFAQAFGAKKEMDVKKWLVASTGFCVVITIPASLVLLFAEKVLVDVLHQDHHLAELSGPFCRYLIPGILPLLLFMCLTKYLQTQNILKISIYIALVSNIANIIINWFLIYYLEWGLTGKLLLHNRAEHRLVST